MKLPQNISQQIQPNLKIAWWGRRALFEVVEEVSEAVFRIYMGLAISWSFFGIVKDYVWPTGYAIAVLVVLLLLSQKAIVECYEWYNEIYVVTYDEANGGGRIHKFWGWLSRKAVNEPITGYSPTIFFDQKWYYRLWGKITGEQMTPTVTRSMSQSFIDGKKISPRFAYTIEKIRGAPAAAKQAQVEEMALTQVIRQALYDDLVDKDYAKKATRTVIDKAVYG